MAIEDTLHPLLKHYLEAPRWLKAPAAGRAYGWAAFPMSSSTGSTVFCSRPAVRMRFATERVLAATGRALRRSQAGGRCWRSSLHAGKEAARSGMTCAE